MHRIPGTLVDLVTPFPFDRIEQLYQWLHAFPSLIRHDDSPADFAAWSRFSNLLSPLSTIYGVELKGGELLGAVIHERSSVRDSYLHVAASRRIWGRGLIDEAAQLCIGEVFVSNPALRRLSVSMMAHNHAAQALARRMGFRFEGTFPDMLERCGKPCNVVHYGLTRRAWVEAGHAASGK